MTAKHDSSHVRCLRVVAPLCNRRCDSCLYVFPFVGHVPRQCPAAGGEGEQSRSTLRKPACGEQSKATRATGDEMGLARGVSVPSGDVRSVHQARHRVPICKQHGLGLNA